MKIENHASVTQELLNFQWVESMIADIKKREFLILVTGLEDLESGDAFKHYSIENDEGRAEIISCLRDCFLKSAMTQLAVSAKKMIALGMTDERIAKAAEYHG